MTALGQPQSHIPAVVYPAVIPKADCEDDRQDPLKMYTMHISVWLLHLPSFNGMVLTVLFHSTLHIFLSVLLLVHNFRPGVALAPVPVRTCVLHMYLRKTYHASFNLTDISLLS